MKKITRHQMRENAFILVFEKLFREESADDILELARECEDLTVNDQVEQMFKGVLDHVADIDVLIEKNLKNWKKERISKVSLAILRLGVYEILYCADVDDDIVVSECVKLATTFAFDDDVSFVNGVLGSVVRGLKA
ncbi:transcription antitermination factor NusB [Fumia xinanensis]|uniref:Transcription antitermination protein NusB n=1 Tax=Fumia xinanensis TaxID=2763659 RepID=A0A926E4A5_9FIRM|nr:transcription antitermination factor NusB [Fumia xinanensis]MBC8559463.1 transcription antitermination factor NusB [Fumia xinanensis]PWL42463.1 MAG: transcription antitermination factor NusB [Clostridiales bacterium]